MERFAELEQVWFHPWIPSDDIGNGYSHTSQLSSALIVMHVLGLMLKELKFAGEVEETKGIFLSPLLLYFCFSLLWIIPSVKRDQNSSLLSLQVLLWLCSSKHWRRSRKAGLNREGRSHSSLFTAFHPTELCLASLAGRILSKLIHLCFDICFSNCIIKNTVCLFHVLLAVNFITWTTILLLRIFWKK